MGYTPSYFRYLIDIGAGTFAGPDGSRQPTGLELGVAKKQGKLFAEFIKKHSP
jgi:hypothetical protein